MTYVTNPKKLSNVIKVLSLHEKEVDQYFLAELKPRIASIENVEDKLWVLFAIANADKPGVGKNSKPLLIATSTFKNGCIEKINEYSHLEPGRAHQYFREWLCDIKGMSQKTANLFLKFLVLLNDEIRVNGIDFSGWEPFLHVPLDRWVLRLLSGNYLNVCGNDFEVDFPKNGGSIKERCYKLLQEDLRQVATLSGKEPIILDMLWFIGSKYCRFESPFCDICWLNGQCMSYKHVDWSEYPSIRTSDERLTARENEKAIRKAVRELKALFLTENPGRSTSDFFSYIQTPEGKDWLNQRLFNKNEQKNEKD